MDSCDIVLTFISESCVAGFFIHLYFWSYRSYLAERNIRVGATNRAVAEVTQRQYDIKRVIKVKENFLQYGPGDITLFELNETVQFTPYIQPICLPEPDEKFSETSICYATGWGYTTPGGKYLIHHFKTVIKVHFRYSLLEMLAFWKFNLTWRFFISLKGHNSMRVYLRIMFDFLFSDNTYSTMLKELKMRLWSTSKCNSTTHWNGNITDSYLCAGYEYNLKSVCTVSVRIKSAFHQ